MIFKESWKMHGFREKPGENPQKMHGDSLENLGRATENAWGFPRKT